MAPEAQHGRKGQCHLPQHVRLPACSHTPAYVQRHRRAHRLHRHIHADAGTHRDTRYSSLALLRGGATDTDTGLSPARDTNTCVHTSLRCVMQKTRKKRFSRLAVTGELQIQVGWGARFSCSHFSILFSLGSLFWNFSWQGLWGTVGEGGEPGGLRVCPASLVEAE